MSLANTYVQAISRIPALLQRIRDGQAPDQFTHQLLKDFGFTSSSDRAFIPLLKAIDFLTPDGKPTARYHDFRDHSRSRRVLGDALLETYKDIFLIKRHPTEADFDAVQGKFKSYHNCSANVAKLMASTFFALLKEADISDAPLVKSNGNSTASAVVPEAPETPRAPTSESRPASLHYNIQIHLPPTKDIEVYNAIFKSLREHLLYE